MILGKNKSNLITSMLCVVADCWRADNIWQTKKFMTSKFGMEPADFHRSFGIPADLDYVE